MADIKNPKAYFSMMIRNSDKNEYRSNDNYFNHISSVGSEADIQYTYAGEKWPLEYDGDMMERLLCEVSAENWLMFMENEQLHNALSRLPLKDVEFLFLIYSVGLRQSDIARLYGVSQGAIGCRHKRLKMKISDFLKIAL